MMSACLEGELVFCGPSTSCPTMTSMTKEGIITGGGCYTYKSNIFHVAAAAEDGSGVALTFFL